MHCLRFAFAVAILPVLAGVSLAGHSKAQIAAAQGFTFQGIGFKNQTSRARETFTEQFPESVGDAEQIDDRGRRSYEAKLPDKRILRARYENGLLYELEIVGPRLQSSYEKLSKQFGQPDVASGYGRSFQWILGNIRVWLRVDQKKEVVVYHDTKHLEAGAGAAAGE
ncbi:MAG: hypothetical protein GTO53_13550 [Planctomycetales bacterium]|nr:hypothetical protein [Planctomycetales bacterium]NIM10116.1 hypothetical protein [Planctomycetales bacterium]NIN09557.1 hypothetical protein [Planctomycetales bacterium]NIN78669.1 hypothetical protein [Planctomycetales bacterium]NIO35858.1 hypothetical protein [Planctomycetales bacterium]